jgi:pilus assembly protein Flp/PilA
MKFFTREEGQGLVEYALILVLVAIVVIAVLLLLGPTVGNVFSDIVENLLEGRGVITSVSAVRTGSGSNDVKVTITVSTSTSVTVSDSQNASPVTASCPGSCTVTLSGVGFDAGTVKVRAAAGGMATAGYPPKP